MKLPQVRKCCFCIPLRYGIIFFGYVNIILSLTVVAFLVITTELRRSRLMEDGSLEVITSTVLFSIFGMSVILNILLLIAGYQKDVSMLRLYNYYGAATILAALVPVFILLSRRMLCDVTVALFAIVMQVYVIVLVRSEILKLEQKQLKAVVEDLQRCPEVIVDVPDTETLM